jgi:hypothetical protein
MQYDGSLNMPSTAYTQYNQYSKLPPSMQYDRSSTLPSKAYMQYSQFLNQTPPLQPGTTSMQYDPVLMHYSPAPMHNMRQCPATNAVPPENICPEHVNMLSADNCPTRMSTYKEDTQMINTSLGTNLVKLEDIHGENNSSMYVHTFNDTSQLDSMMYRNLCETYAQHSPYNVYSSNQNTTPCQSWTT